MVVKTRILALFLAMTPGIALSGDATGVIAEVHLGHLYGTRVFIRIEGTVTGQPACQANVFHFVFDLAGAAGKETLATVLTAKAAQQPVKVNGYNQCTMWGSVEDLRHISIK